MALYTVVKGDNLTFIARRFGVKHWRDLYNHPKNAEFRHKRPNPNLIYPGDQLFIPGWSDQPTEYDMREMEIIGEIKPDTPIKELTKEQRKAVVKTALESLPRDVQQDVIDVLKWTGRGLKVAQLAELAGLIGQGAWMGAIPAVLSLQLILGWLRALDTNNRMYGMRALAYTTTAWTFNATKRPSGSPAMMELFEQWNWDDKKLERRQETWDKVSRKTWKNLQAEPRKTGIDKVVIQAAFLTVARREQKHHGSEEKRLCLYLLKALEKETKRGIERTNWRQGYRILYPD